MTQQPVDSGQEELKMDDIIRISCALTGEPGDPEQVIRKVRVEFASPDIWKIRAGNTIFGVHKTEKPGYGLLRILNADTAFNYAKNAKVFIDAAKGAGFSVLVVNFRDQRMIQMMKMALKGIPGVSAEVRQYERGFRAVITIGGGAA